MRHIHKNLPPQVLTAWKALHPSAVYKDLSDTQRRALRQAGLAEQGSLCAYCTCPVSVDNGRNAHLVAQTVKPHLSLVWDNIVVSCDTNCQCDREQGPRTLRLTPLMPECERELHFTLSGKISGNTQRAKDAIEFLGLDARALSNKRREAIDLLLFGHSLKSTELAQHEECWEALLQECTLRDDLGAFMPYAPVLANVLRQLMATKAQG